MFYQKVSQEIFNKVNENVQALAKLFPSAVKDGEVDFEALKEELGQFQEVGKEKYELTWAGKQNAKRIANEDILGKTLKFVPEDSKDADTTENLYISGDNLEVLKLIRHNYYNSIRLIFIDPPYNTGNDFIYSDEFSLESIESAVLEGEIEDGERLIINQKSNNRYHAVWLSMMYSRLKVAKDLLTDDGVIFISIDDNEQSNLKLLCDEVFGADNFINQISVKTKVAGVSGSHQGKSLQNNLEYILMYAKNHSEFLMKNVPYKEKELMEYINEMEKEGKSWKYVQVLTEIDEGELVAKTVDGNNAEIQIYKHSNAKTVSIKTLAEEKYNNDLQKAYYENIDKIFDTTNAQSSIRERVMQSTDGIESDIISIVYTPRSGKNKDKKTRLYYKGPKRRLFTWLKDTVVIKEDGSVYKRDRLGNLWEHIPYNNISKEGSVKYSNGKKPLQMILDIIGMICSENDIIIDFFSGSATTAHATLLNNAINGANNKFIMVQLPENLDENFKKATGQTKKDIEEIIKYLDEVNRPHTLDQLGIERIIHAKKEILDQYNDEDIVDRIDFGFKVFRVSDTNIRWTNEALKGKEMTIVESSMSDKDKLDFMPHATDIDVVYEIMLRQRNIPLSSKVEKLSEIGERTYIFADSYVVCLEENITEELVERLAAIEPLPIKYIFRDSAFEDNISLKDETFRRLEVLINRNTGDSKKTYTVEFL